MLTLSAVEVRVLGALIEKESTTPEQYPLSLNALVNACNQKSSREPVMELGEAEVRTALFELENLELVRVLADARVSKFEHRAYDRLGLRRPEIAVLCLLLLRGPQTAAELRARAERLFAFDDTAAVAATLERMAAREEADGSPALLVRQLERQPGSKERRWMHLLAGSAEMQEGPVDAQEEASARSREGALQQRVTALENAMRAMEDRMSALEEEPQ
jgi:hypothetical protein